MQYVDGLDLSEQETLFAAICYGSMMSIYINKASGKGDAHSLSKLYLSTGTMSSAEARRCYCRL